MKRLSIAASLALAGLVAGCGGTLPTGPTPFAGITSVASSAGIPTVAAVSPNTGSTGGFTTMKITGTGFESGGKVTLGGITVTPRFDSRDVDGKTMYIETPAHAAGAVDVVVTNLAGRAGTLTAGYVYSPPEAFDFNGTWWGYGNAGQDIPIGFTIENNQLVSVSCYTYATLTFSPPRAVVNGEFSFSGDAGVAVSGAIVAASAAHGTINIAPCSATIWIATRQ